MVLSAVQQCFRVGTVARVVLDHGVDFMVGQDNVSVQGHQAAIHVGKVVYMVSKEDKILPTPVPKR